jgi:hypothetical protein
MSLLFFDGLDWIGGSTTVPSQTCYTMGWDEFSVDFSSGLDKTGRNAGSYAYNSSNNNYLVKYLPVNAGTMFFACSFKVTGAGNTTPFLLFMDGTTVQSSFGFNSSGQLTFYTGTGTLVNTSSNAFTTGQWYWMCLKVVFGSSGSYEARINGTSWLSGTGANTITTSNSFCNRFQLGVSGDPTYFVDDIILYDNSGSLPFNDFITERRIITKFVTSDDNATGWTASSGTASQCVDDTYSNDDTDYIVSDKSGLPATFNFDNSFPLTGAFNAVKIHAPCRSEEPTTRVVSGAIKIGSTVYTGSGVAPDPSINYKDCFYQFEKDPSTSGTISGATLNSAKIGVQIIN